MPKLSYDARLLARIPEGDSWVRLLCDPPRPQLEQHARTLERWYNEMAAGDRGLHGRLTSSIDQQFEGGRWELIAARFFQSRGYTVEFEPRVQTGESAAAKTPDLRVDNGSLRYLVEVLQLNPDSAQREQEQHVKSLGNELTARVSFANGLVSLHLVPPERLAAYPNADTISGIVSALQTWLDAGMPDGRLELWGGALPFYASWMPREEPLVLVIPAGRAIGGADRMQPRIASKLAKYRDVDETLVIFVAADHWTISRHAMIQAMFGAEVVDFDLIDPTIQRARYTGEGALVRGGAMGDSGTAITAGCIFARQEMFNGDTGSWNVDLAFVHNPYGERRLPDNTFAPFPEQQVVGPGMVWVRDHDRVVAVLA